MIGMVPGVVPFLVDDLILIICSRLAAATDISGERHALVFRTFGIAGDRYANLFSKQGVCGWRGEEAV
jgi:hypothetical protein